MPYCEKGGKPVFLNHVRYADHTGIPENGKSKKKKVEKSQFREKVDKISNRKGRTRRTFVGFQRGKMGGKTKGGGKKRGRLD